ncbi:MAG: exodeoxyribonuclease VII large subunit [Desulfovibrionaceae bacterium]
MAHIFTVREITGAIKRVLEGEFPFVWVKGQVSSLSRPGSGHLYFSLMDGEASLNVVWFKGSQRTADAGHDPLTGEVVERPAASIAATLANGQEIMCGGRLNVYPPRGQYQLVAEVVQDMGLGRLYLEFEAMKRALAAKGYFDLERKRPLPPHPRRVAVVTALAGAALRDFLRIASERGYGARIRIHPCLVQGADAPAQIAAALDTVNAQGWADVAVVIRGGGSLEDLWAFNTEPVADAVFRCAVPVVSGVGHEVDISITDLVADVRAATPSHAAQMLWPERRLLEQAVDGLETDLHAAWGRFFTARRQALESLEKGLAWLSPAARLGRLDEQFAEARERLDRAVGRYLERREETVARAGQAVASLFGAARLQGRADAVEALAGRLLRAGGQCAADRERRLDLLAATLAGLDPQRPLERGYSLVYVPKNKAYLRSAADVAPGDRLDIHVKDGTVTAAVAGPKAKTKRADGAATQELLPL